MQSPPIGLFGTDQGECDSPIRKSFVMTPSNSSIATINQHLNNLGTINQQLTTLSQQLTGLNQQSQNLQHFQNFGNNLNQLHHMSMNSVQNLNTLVNTSNGIYQPINTTMADSTNQNVPNDDENIVNPMLNTPTRMAKLTTTNLIQNDLFQSNQELLNRLQSLSLGLGNNNNNNNKSNIINGNYSPCNSFLYTNANASLSGSSPLTTMTNVINAMPNHNNNNLNMLTPSPSIANFTPSPVFNRSPYSTSPLLDSSSTMNLHNNNNISSTGINHSSPSKFGDDTCNIDESHKFIRPIASTPLNGTVLTIPQVNTKHRPLTPISLISSEVWKLNRIK